MRPKLVIGNWKMHGSLAANLGLLTAIRNGLVDGGSTVAARVALCVPFPYLAQARSVLGGSPVAWGAQDVSEYRSGAYTGEVSVSMLADFGARYVLVGHSERRSLFAERDEVVAEKAYAALKAGLAPVICVGESLSERESGQTATVVLRQLSAVVSRCGVEALVGAVVAYEPVWAIGTGRTASPAQVQEVHQVLRRWIAERSSAVADRLPLLYGGSVKAANARELFGQPDVDGGLIGGASLEATDFLVICQSA